MAASQSSTERQRWLSAPNVVTALRVFGSPTLILLALNDLAVGVAIVVAILVFTEWLDGFLARTLHQESELGARLDTIADASFYVSILVALVILSPVVTREAAWMAAAIISFAGSCLVSLIKFRRLPSYHTWMAKGGWLVVGAGTVSLLAGWSAWPFRIAMVCVVLANLEALAITILLSKPRVNVRSLWQVLRTKHDC